MDPAIEKLADEGSDDFKEATGFFMALQIAVAGIALAVVMLMVAGSTSTILSGIFNPEYLALREILEALP